MRHDAPKLLADILAAGEAITKYLGGKDRAGFEADPMMRAAIERQFMIIGEAVRRMEEVAPATAQRIVNRRRLVDFRNILAHGYDGVDDDVVWHAASEKLPELMGEVRALATKEKGMGKEKGTGNREQ